MKEKDRIKYSEDSIRREDSRQHERTKQKIEYLTPARRSSLEPQRAQRYWPHPLQTAGGQAHTDNCRLAQGFEVSQNERKQTCLLSFHSCLPSMPATSSAGSPLPGPLERPHTKVHRTLSIPYSRSASADSFRGLELGKTGDFLSQYSL
jgi:hypothetical protein